MSQDHKPGASQRYNLQMRTMLGTMKPYPKCTSVDVTEWSCRPEIFVLPLAGW
jgi:hypothetical protein